MVGTILLCVVSFIFGWFCMACFFVERVIGTIETDDSNGDCLIELENHAAIDKLETYKYVVFKNKKVD